VVVVETEPEDFMSVISKSEKPLVITVSSGVMKKEYKYLTTCRGLIFFTRSKTPLELPPGIDVVVAKNT